MSMTFGTHWVVVVQTSLVHWAKSSRQYEENKKRFHYCPCARSECIFTTIMSGGTSELDLMLFIPRRRPGDIGLSMSDHPSFRPSFLPFSGRRPDIDWNTVSKGR